MAGPDRVRRHFGDVDRAPDPTKVVGYLDAASGLGNIQRLKRTTYEFLGPVPGQVLLDVGCGVGDDVRALAGIVAPTGRAVGLDFSRSLVAEVHTRSRGGQGRTEFTRGDSCHLPFPDNAFDGVRSERMLQHLREPRRAVGEMARVVKSGGRVVDFDPDWDMMAIDATDLELTRRIVHARTDGLMNGSVGRQLFAMFRDGGLVDVSVVPMATMVPSFAIANSMLELEATVERARATGAIAAADAAAWLSEMRERDASGRFFCGLTGYLAHGRKP